MVDRVANMTKLQIFLFLLVISFAPCSASTPQKVAPGVFKVPLKLPRSLEKRRAEFESDLLEAQRRLRSFSEKHDWENLTDEPLMRRAEIYDNKRDYDDHLYKLEPSLRGKPIPKTFTAGIEQDVFFAVTPEICNEVFPQGKEKDSYIKLILHELTHRLHVRIVKGEEDRMGPIWFFEGFAIHGADQYSAKAPKLSENEIWEIVGEKSRGSYLKYRTVFDYFLRKHSLLELLDHAGGKDFADWLRTEPTRHDR